MAINVIAGCQWGDEGKGKVVDGESADTDAVVRCGGGANAGHTVYVGEEKFVLHLVPSGILYVRPDCVIGNGVVVDCNALIGEMAELTRRRVSVKKLFISNAAHMVMWWHIVRDRLSEKRAAEESGHPGSVKIGTTGRGIGPCYSTKTERRFAIRVGELLNVEKLLNRIEEEIFPVMVKRLMDEFPGENIMEKDTSAKAANIKLTETMQEITDWAEFLRPFITDTDALLRDMLKRNPQSKILIELAQGGMLDVDSGTYPYVTSCNTTIGGALTGTGLSTADMDMVIVVAKAYSTRVGEGPLPTELLDKTGQWLRTAGKEYGATTGRPRRCGWLDLVVVKYIAGLNGATLMYLTKLDILSGLEVVRICTAYKLDGQLIHRPPKDADQYARCEPIYEDLPGWEKDINAIPNWQNWPENARRYVLRIQELTGVKIYRVGNGKSRHEYVDVPELTKP